MTVLVDADTITATRADRTLFRDLSITIEDKDRVGVVGINGTGKSTLLRVLAGTQLPESGEVRRGRGVRISVLDQDAPLEGTTIRDVVGDGWESRAILERLGMGSLLEASLRSLSGGQAKRVALARALSQPAELLILDEPTNHLDLLGIEWLERWIDRFNGGVVIVSHDRFLLDNVTTRMLELDRGNTFIHNQGYAEYLDAKAERAERAQDADTVRRNLARRELAWLRRGAKARTRKPQARIAAARALIETRPDAPERTSAMELGFPTPRLGNTVIELEDVTVGYGTESGPVIEGLTLRLDPRERLGIVGTNGSGKSTLLATIAGELRPLHGSRVEGTTVAIGHYTQRSREYPADIRVREVVAGPHGNPNDLTIQRLLERFWFTGELPYATVGTLSGGERRRLQLLEVLAQQPNVLLLDEPTNDLDLDTLRALEEFLEAWPGALVVVSHDRAFLDRVTSRLLACDQGSAEEVPGGLSTWLERLRTTQAGSMAKPATVSPSSSDTPQARSSTLSRAKSESTLGFQMRELEKTMERLRKQERSLVQRFEQAADHHALIELGKELAEVQDQLSRAEESWLEIAEEAEQVRAARRA